MPTIKVCCASPTNTGKYFCTMNWEISVKLQIELYDFLVYNHHRA